MEPRIRELRLENEKARRLARLANRLGKIGAEIDQLPTTQNEHRLAGQPAFCGLILMGLP
jgi:hypothetical protein